MNNKEIINSACFKTGLSRGELAKMLGISPGHLNNICSGLKMSKTLENFIKYIVKNNKRR